MFTAKQTSLIEKKQVKTASAKATTGTAPLFVQAGLKKGAETLSGNGSLKYSTTGNPFVDQFGKLGAYKKPRTFSEIEKDCEILWAANQLDAVKMAFYMRLINRKIQFADGSQTETPQKGAELRHEGIMRMIWLSQKALNTFWNNIQLFVAVGGWKDIITMLQYDLVYNTWNKKVLNWEKFGNLILSGLENKNTSELLKKYLPQIQSESKTKTVEAQADTIIAKWICSLLFGNAPEAGIARGSHYKKYRKLKTSGTAHEWQKLISQKKFDRIDFDKVHGRALNLMVRSKFLKNQGLTEKYEAWVTNPETKEVKYTGFVSELFQDMGANGGYGINVKYQTLSAVPVSIRETVNKQFAELVRKGGETEQTPLIVVRDTSGSMGSLATGCKMTCYAVAKSLALYFSEFLKGKFANSWIEFNRTAKMHEWKGNTPLEKWFNDNSDFVGSTDFESVIRLFATIKHQGVSEAEFPRGIVCISDGMFNPAQLGQTNVESARSLLRQAGFSETYVNDFVIVLWNLKSSAYGGKAGNQFETFGAVKNVFYLSGYSAANIGLLTSKISTAEELVEAALSQEVLQMVKL